MRAASLPSLRGLISSAQSLRIAVAKAVDQAAITARHGPGYSDGATALAAFLVAAIAANRTFTRAASIASLPTTATVSATIPRVPAPTITATYADAGTEIVLRSATATVTIAAGLPANGNTVTINGKTYTYQTVLTNVDGNVLIGADVTACALNLANAIRLGTGSGSTYAAATTVHPNVGATAAAGVVTLFNHSVSPLGANAFAISRVGANITLSGTTLSGGLFDGRVTFVSADPTKVTVGTYGVPRWIATGSSVVTYTYHGRTATLTVTAS